MPSESLPLSTWLIGKSMVEKTVVDLVGWLEVSFNNPPNILKGMSENQESASHRKNRPEVETGILTENVGDRESRGGLPSEDFVQKFATEYSGGSMSTKIAIGSSVRLGVTEHLVDPQTEQTNFLDEQSLEPELVIEEDDK